MTISKNLNSKSPIAFFDSGVGGLTVFSKVKRLLPNEDLVYYGDTLHMPYGEKSKADLLKYSNNIFKFFEDLGCKAVVMACNTTSSVVYREVVDRYKFELYPIVQSVSEILSSLPITRLGVFATRATIESNAYQNEITKYNSDMCVFGQFCPSWVHIVENNLINNEESIKLIKSDLDKMLDNSPEKIVLGCTHYPFLIDILSKFVEKDLFIDPAEDFAKFIVNDLKTKQLLNKNTDLGKDSFYVSSNPDGFIGNAKLFYNVTVRPQIITFE